MRAIIPAVLILVLQLNCARADEQRTFCGKTVEGWTQVLRDQTATSAERRQAMSALGCFGPEAKAAVPDLIRLNAVGALVEIGSGAEVTVPVLIKQFVEAGCQHLTGMGTFVRFRNVEDALTRIGEPAVPALVEVLNGPDKGMRVCAAAELAEIGPAARAAAPSLIRAIEHPTPDREGAILTDYAVRALGRIGPDAKAAIPALNHLLDKDGKNDRHRGDLVTALARLGAPPVRKLLDVFLAEADQRACYQLAQLGPLAREAVPALRAALTDKRPQARYYAAVALAHIDTSVAESIPVLIEALNHLDDADLDLDSFVPVAIARLGPSAKAALPALMRLVKSGTEDTGVYRALAQIDPEGKECVPAFPVLRDTLKELREKSRDYPEVVIALYQLAPDGREIAERWLDQTMNEPQLDTHSQALKNRALVLAAMGRSSVEGDCLTRRYLERIDRMAAAFAEDDYFSFDFLEEWFDFLGRLGVGARLAIPRLNELRNHANPWVRMWATEALRRIRPEDVR